MQKVLLSMSKKVLAAAPRPRAAKARVSHGGGEPREPGQKEEGQLIDAEVVSE